MKLIALTPRAFGRWSVIALAAFVLAGCVTQKINWSARVGNYTYDQAVTELGPPDKSAKLADGTVVAEWLTRRGYTYTTPEAYPYYSRWYGSPVAPPPNTTRVPDYFLRLTFGSDGRLTAWKKFAQ
jgi:hypothetical protein